MSQATDKLNRALGYTARLPYAPKSGEKVTVKVTYRDPTDEELSEIAEVFRTVPGAEKGIIRG